MSPYESVSNVINFAAAAMLQENLKYAFLVVRSNDGRLKTVCVANDKDIPEVLAATEKTKAECLQAWIVNAVSQQHQDLAEVHPNGFTLHYER